MTTVSSHNAKVRTLYLSGLEGMVAEVEASIFEPAAISKHFTGIPA